MLDKTQQFEQLMIHHLSEKISDSDDCVLLDRLNSDPKFKVLYNEMAKTRAISLIQFIESPKTSSFKLLQKLLNKGLYLSNQHNFLN